MEAIFTASIPIALSPCLLVTRRRRRIAPGDDGDVVGVILIILTLKKVGF